MTTGEGKKKRRRLVHAPLLPGGVLATARRQGHTQKLERPSSSRLETAGEARPYNRKGKWVEDERESDGPIVVSKAGNAAGAKGPC